MRRFNIYGPCRSTRLYSGVVTRFADALTHQKPLKIFEDGEQTSYFTYVSDVADAIILALGLQEASGITFNIGTGTETSVNQVAALFATFDQ